MVEFCWLCPTGHWLGVHCWMRLSRERTAVEREDPAAVESRCRQCGRRKTGWKRKRQSGRARCRTAGGRFHDTHLTDARRSRLLNCRRDRDHWHPRGAYCCRRSRRHARRPAALNAKATSRISHWHCKTITTLASRFPRAWCKLIRRRPTRRTPHLGNWSWSALILPFVEETRRHALVDVAKTDLATSMDTPANLRHAERHGRVSLPDGYGPAFNEERLDHEALAGTDKSSGHVELCGSQQQRRIAPRSRRPRNFANGVFVRIKGRKIARITDGTSHTAILGERAGNRSCPVAARNCRSRAVLSLAFAEYGMTPNKDSRTAWAAARYQLNFSSSTGAFQIRAQGEVSPACTRAGAHFGLADGSVQFVSDTSKAISTPINGRSPTPSIARGKRCWASTMVSAIAARSRMRI